MVLGNDSPQIKILRVLVENNGVAETEKIINILGLPKAGVHNRARYMIAGGLVKRESSVYQIRKGLPRRKSIYRIPPNMRDFARKILERADKIDNGLLCHACGQEIKKHGSNN